MPTECCVPQCTNRGGHAFPWSQKDRVKIWTVVILRDFWKPTIHSVVCSNHFNSSDYVCKTSFGTKPLQKKLKPTAVPHIFNWTPAESSATLKRRKRHIQREFKQNTQVW
ncbi:hypothetical protein ACJMK2_003337 [Sinanodonta woodiana]|uniref:THAP-type domain-containing protein n=1 Tax=Sinanodonta woodiana TaxID=1069815 RepID=A0ABD3XY15_SINWO